MKVVTPTLKKEIEALLPAGNLIEIVHLLDKGNTDMKILLLKSQLNKLKQDKAFISEIEYHEMMIKLKQTICNMVGIANSPLKIDLK